jgi:hypothetical protein
MREQAFVTVATTSTSREAESVAHVLQRAGLHPAVVSVTTPSPAVPGANVFPVDVPTDEAPLAQQILKSHYLAKTPES